MLDDTFEKLPKASIERTVTENAVPAVAFAGTEVIWNLAAAPGLTVNVFDVPVFELPVAVIVELAPGWVSVTARLARTPALKAGVVPQPAEQVRLEVRLTVPVKPVCVLLN